VRPVDVERFVEGEKGKWKIVESGLTRALLEPGAIRGVGGYGSTYRHAEVRWIVAVLPEE